MNAYGFTVFLGSDRKVGFALGRSVPVIAAKRDDAIATINQTFGVDILATEGPVVVLENALDATAGGTVAGPLNAVQFDNAGSFGGDAFLTWIHPVTPSVNATLLLVGDTNNAATLDIHNSTSNNINLFTHSSNGFQGPAFNLLRSRGTQSAPASLVIGDNLGYLTFMGWNGTSYVIAAQITVQAGSGGFSGSTNATSFEFFATPPNSTALVEVLRLCNTSGVNISELGFGVIAGNTLGFAQSGNQIIDTAFSRLAPNSVALGNGTQGDFSGSLTLGKVIGGASMRGTASSASGTTVSVTFATAYGSTPAIVVTPTSNCGTFYISAQSATGFTITYSTSGAASFNWIAIG